MARISYSQYSLYKNCPKQYKLRYYDKLSTFTNNIHLIFGKAMHTTIQTWLDCIYKESIRKAEQLDLYTMLKEELVKEFIDAEAKDKQVPCTREEIEKFVNSLTNQQLEKITEFVESMPTMKHEQKFTCKKCQHENTVELKGLQDFF